MFGVDTILPGMHRYTVCMKRSVFLLKKALIFIALFLNVVQVHSHGVLGHSMVVTNVPLPVTGAGGEFDTVHTVEELSDHSIEIDNPVPVENVYEYCGTKRSREIKCDKDWDAFRNTGLDVLFECGNGESAVEIREDEKNLLNLLEV